MTMTADNETDLKDGRVVAIAGPVVDVEFPPNALPEINWALELDIELDGETITVTTERKSLGHYELSRVVLPSTGTWTLTLQVRATEVDAYPTVQRIEVK